VLTSEPRAIVGAAGTAVVGSLPCRPEHPNAPLPGAATLDPPIRLVSWNIHKQADAGWQEDLRAFVARSDVVLLQEAVLDDPIRRALDDEGLAFTMASSFGFAGYDIGVLTASRVRPLAACTLRIFEPLLGIPKSTVITWFALAGADQTLAVANVHAINFAPTLEGYVAQLDAIGDALASQRGPLVVAGDLNTWSAARADAVRALVRRLGLTEVALHARTRFLGREVDHVYVRGLAVVEASALGVTSSDHNPVFATLRTLP
jgi:endonuclease/exonuclease/phosphatase (EEP) superfamily protein YafD